MSVEAYPVGTGFMCECCWSHRDMDRPDSYSDEVRHHEATGCPCTKPGIEGARRRAGQWWDEEAKCDTRTKEQPR